MQKEKGEGEREREEDKCAALTARSLFEHSSLQSFCGTLNAFVAAVPRPQARPPLRHVAHCVRYQASCS